jgi:hypothetical protein
MSTFHTRGYHWDSYNNKTRQQNTEQNNNTLFAFAELLHMIFASLHSPHQTVFQLRSPDTIYSRAEEMKKSVGGYTAFLGWRAAHMLLAAGVIEGRKRLG